MTYSDQFYKDASGSVIFMSAKDHEQAVENGYAFPAPDWTAITADEAAAALAPTTAQLWAEYQAAARTALSDSDTTVIRCYENAVALPAAWLTYRKALRVIVGSTSGDATQALPTKPAYPIGT